MTRRGWQNRAQRDWLTAGAREVPDLPAAMTAARADLPIEVVNDAEAFRASILAVHGTLGATMRQAEAAVLAGELGGRAAVELWSWAAYLGIVRGYRMQTTGAVYCASLSRYLRWCHAEGIDYAETTLPQFDAWLRWLFLVHRSGNKTRSTSTCAMRSFYEWRFTRGMGKHCAANLRPARESLHMPRKYSVAQLRSLLAANKERTPERLQLRDRTVLLFLLATGARREELSNVQMRDLELRTNTGTVRFEGKGAKQREVSFEGPLVDTLRLWLHERDNLPFDFDKRWLFIGVHGAQAGGRLQVRAIENLVAWHARHAGLRDWGVHRFRTTFATALYDDGADIEEIRILLGHESIETTRRYLAVSERARRTRLRSDRMHEVLGTRRTGQPRWVRAALGGARE